MRKRLARSKAMTTKHGEAAPVAARPEADATTGTHAGSGRNGNLILADLALQGGAYLLRQGIERGLLGRKLPTGKALKQAKGLGLGGSLVHGAIARIATSSVPGAILVGGGLLAKTLHNRRKARRLRDAAPAEQAGGDEPGEQT